MREPTLDEAIALAEQMLRDRLWDAVSDLRSRDDAELEAQFRLLADCARACALLAAHPEWTLRAYRAEGGEVLWYVSESGGMVGLHAYPTPHAAVLAADAARERQEDA